MIRVTDIAFVRFAAPDLDVMERFLHDFGMETSARSSTALFCRGTDPQPFVHATERGEPGFRGVAFEAASAEDLTHVSSYEGASAVEPLPGPGGGARVRLTDPDGFCVEVVHGRAPADALPVRRSPPINLGSQAPRRGVRVELVKGPAQVKRIGHCVLRVSDFRRSQDWYQERFGFLTSDEVYLGDPSRIVTAFLRCDRGGRFVDHHTLLCVGLGEPGFDHAAFEVEDTDQLMLGHDHLAAAGHAHHAGVGRHVLGSQVFDYWRDPWGHVVEHFTDGDLLDAGAKPGLHDPGTALGTWWGRFGGP